MIKRKRFFVYPTFQGNLIGIGLISLGLVFVCVGLEFYLSYRTLIKMGLDVKLPENHSYFRFVGLQFKTIMTHLMIGFVFSSFVSFIISLLISHRMAGPLIRLQNYFKEIQKTGALPKEDLSFRKGDYIQHLAPLLNDALKKLEKK